jgi:hypothetical protein
MKLTRLLMVSFLFTYVHLSDSENYRNQWLKYANFCQQSDLSDRVNIVLRDYGMKLIAYYYLPPNTEHTMLDEAAIAANIDRVLHNLTAVGDS